MAVKTKPINICGTIPVNCWNCYANKLWLSLSSSDTKTEKLKSFCQQNNGIIGLALAPCVTDVFAKVLTERCYSITNRQYFKKMQKKMLKILFTSSSTNKNHEITALMKRYTCHSFMI